MSTSNDIREQFGEHECQLCGTDCIAVAEIIEEKEAKLAAIPPLSEELRRYVRHLPGCKYQPATHGAWSGLPQKTFPCTCGLTKLLREADSLANGKDK